MLSTIVLALTLACVVGGILLGFIRGFTRALIRFFIIVICAVVAWFLRSVITNALMGIQIEGQPLGEYLSSSLGGDLQGIANTVTTIVRILVGILSFLIIFIVLQLLTWIIVGPILLKTVGGGLRIVGMVVGLIQGLVTAFLICSILTGLAGVIGKFNLPSAEGEEGGVSGIEQTLGIEDYKNSFLGKTYGTIGGWLFDSLSTEGDVSLNSTATAISSVVKVMDNLQTIQDLDLSNGINDDNIVELSNALRELGNVQGDLNSDEKAKKVINDLISDLSGDEGDVSLPENFMEEMDFTSAADAMDEINNYKKSEEPITDGNIDKIVSGLVTNTVVVDAIGEKQLVQVKEEDKERFNQKLQEKAAEQNLSQEEIEKIEKMLGLREIALAEPEAPEVAA